MFPFTVVPAYNLPVYASQRPSPDATQELGTWLLARLCRGRHLRRLSCTHLQGATLTDSGRDTLASSGSCHRWKAAAFRREMGLLPPPDGCGWPTPTAVTHPLGSTGITPASSLLRGGPPLSGASVLSVSRLVPLVPFPLASPARFFTVTDFHRLPSAGLPAHPSTTSESDNARSIVKSPKIEQRTPRGVSQPIYAHAMPKLASCRSLKPGGLP